MIDPSIIVGGLSALGNLGGTFINSALSTKDQAKMMRYQYRLNQRGLLENPSKSRQGLVKAGYNPLLALGSNVSGFSANAPNIASDSDLGSDSVNSAVKAGQIGLQKSQKEQVDANTNLTNEQAETEKAKRTQMEFQNAETQVRTQLGRKDLDTYDERFYNTMRELIERTKQYSVSSAIQSRMADIQAESVKNSYALGKESNSNAAARNKIESNKSSTNLKLGPFSFSHSGVYQPHSANSKNHYNRSASQRRLDYINAYRDF